MNKRTLYFLAAAVGVIALAVVFRPYEPQALGQEATCRAFPETGKRVCGKFLKYWKEHGGLAQQGFPLSEEFKEVSEADGKTYTVQYFERAVFELHSENKPPYDVLLSRLGAFQFKRKYPGGGPGGGASTPPPGADPWAGLSLRPLRVPTQAPGSACATARSGVVSPDFGAALGGGPVYPVGFDPAGVYYYAGAIEEGGWFLLKVLWIGSPEYRGPALVRGHQVDGPNEARFGEGPNPGKELRLEAGGDANRSASGWSDWPTYTRLRAPGCYAYQVDGANFSEVVVFKALDRMPPPP